MYWMIFRFFVFIYWKRSIRKGGGYGGYGSGYKGVYGYGYGGEYGGILVKYLV